MYLLLAFAIALLIAVYLSELAERSLISTSIVFLAAGFIVGPGVLNLIHLNPSESWVSLFVEVTLVTVLFTEGMEIQADEVRSVWKLAGRTLIAGMPLTVVIIAVLAYLMTGISWGQAFLIGAVLSPTDPVFAAALVKQPVVPEKLRHLLNLESGVNDGLALPLILTGLTILFREEFEVLSWVGELALGVLIGVGAAWALFKLKEVFRIKVAEVYEPLLALAVGLLVFALAELLHGNIFLAAFAAGVTTATVSVECSRSYLEIGAPISEVLKLSSVLLFGSLLSISFFSGISLAHLLFAILVLFLARPIALSLSLAGSSLSWRERLAVGWFGPRGFASVIYALLVFRYSPPDSGLLVSLIVLVILLSIVLHSSTDSLATPLFENSGKQESQGTE